MIKPDAARKIHPTLGRSYWARALAYAAGSILVVSCIPPENSVTIWVVLFFGFVYPTLFYQLGYFRDVNMLEEEPNVIVIFVKISHCSPYIF